jgi:hypothetical protein
VLRSGRWAKRAIFATEVESFATAFASFAGAFVAVATAFGAFAVADAYFAAEFLALATALVAFAVAFTTNSTAFAANSTAFGIKSTAFEANSTAFGAHSVASGLFAVAEMCRFRAIFGCKSVSLDRWTALGRRSMDRPFLKADSPSRGFNSAGRRLGNRCGRARRFPFRRALQFPQLGHVRCCLGRRTGRKPAAP